MLGRKKQTFYAFRLKIGVGVGTALFLSLTVAAPTAQAAWNLPTCNPDSVGPTDSSCLVSAPLNVSSASQTKTGTLTVQNTVNAGQLNVSTAYSGNGRVGITASTGVALTITHSAATASAVSITANTSASAYTLTQSGTGTGAQIQAAAGYGLVSANNSASNPAGSFQNAGTGTGVTVTSTTGIGLSVGNSSSSNATISAQNSSSASAVQGTNTSSTNAAVYGVNSNASAYGGVRGCSSVSGYCTTLGSGTLAAYLQGPGSVGSSSSRLTSGNAFSVYAQNSGVRGVYIDTSNDATGLSITAAGTNGVGASITNTGTNAQAISITSSSTTQLINVSSSGNSATGLNMSMTGTGTKGVSINVGASSTGVTVTGSGTYGVQATGSSAGVQGNSSGGYGIQGVSTTGFGGLFSSATTTGSAVFIQNTSSGDGASVETGGVTVGSIPNPSGWPSAGGRGFRATSATSYGVVGYSTAATGYGVGVLGVASSNYGVVGNSTSSYGVYGNSASSTSYGGLFCNAGNVNCASLGGGTYAGLFSSGSSGSGRVRIDANTSGNAGLRVGNKNITAPYGYAIQGYSQTGSLTPSTPADGTAIDGQAYNGYGVYGYSQQDTGVYGYGNDGGVYGASASAGGYGVYGGATTGSGVQGAATTGYGVYGSATTGYAGYFTNTGNSATTLYVANSDTTYGYSRYGVDVAMGSSPGSVAYHASIAYGTGFYAQVSDGGTGVLLSTSSDAVGISISPDEFNDTTISTTEGFMDIANGGILGGIHIPDYFTPYGAHNNTQAYTDVGSYSVSTATKIEDMFYDGADVWFADDNNASSLVHRLAGIDGTEVQSVDVSDDALFLVRSDSGTRMIVVTDTSYKFIELYDQTSTSAPLSIADASTTITAAAMVGTELWFAQDDGDIKYLDFTHSPSNVTTGTGTVYTILNAAGYAWIGDTDNNAILRVDPSTHSTTSYAVTGRPSYMVFDGEFIWYLSTSSTGIIKTLYRFSIVDHTDESVVSVGGLGSAAVTAIAFDGVNIWVGHSDGTVDQYNIPTSTLTSSKLSYSSSIQKIQYDGTYLWIADRDGAHKIATGSGNDVPTSAVRRGVLTIDHTDGDMYCIYLDSGTVTVGDPTDCD